MKLSNRRNRGNVITETAVAVAMLSIAATYQLQSFTTSVAQTVHAANVETAQCWLDNFSALMSSGTVTSSGAITLATTLTQGITFSTGSTLTFTNIAIGAGRNATSRYNGTVTTQVFDRGTAGNSRMYEYYITLSASRRLPGGSTKTYVFSRSILRQVQL